MRRPAAYVALFACALLGTFASRAAAGGLEYAGAGATALGRGGAVAARADDPMVLSYNPAGLAELRGTQLLLDSNIALMKACVEPIGYYGWGVYDGGGPSQFRDPKTGATQTLNLGDASKQGRAEKAYYVTPYDTVCMQQHVVPVPQLALTHRVSERLGIGFGLIFPGITPQGRWGADNAVVRGPNGELRPAITRYMQINSGTLGLFPTLGFGYRLTDWLHIGASFEWGMIWVNNTNMAALSAGTNPAGDILAHLQGHDYFIPAVNASLQVVPFDNLDIVAGFRAEDDIAIKRAQLDLTTGIYDANGKPYTTHDLGASFHQKMPWKVRGGLRYADRLLPRPTGTGAGEAKHGQLHDPIADERWDIEADVEYQMNARVQDQTVTYELQQQLGTLNLMNQVNFATFPVPGNEKTTIEKHWKDQISARLGGTYNVVPNVFALSAGAHYETRGVDPSFMQIDFWPVRRIGLHAGVTVRVFKQTDIVVSYAHIFQETLVVGAPLQEDASDIYKRYIDSGSDQRAVNTIDRTVGTQLTRGQVLPKAIEPSPGKTDGTADLKQIITRSQAGQPPWIINSGTYRSGIDVVAIGVHTHF